jgi:hypothetical protein
MSLAASVTNRLSTQYTTHTLKPCACSIAATRLNTGTCEYSSICPGQSSSR